jgi:gamma-glutamylcyclotransferase (GGCT)/AIG2-like uncharacterized protein YtfP
MPHTVSRSHQATSQPSGQRDRLSVDPDALFVYGSLLFPEVLRALLDRVPDSTTATVVGWRVAALLDRVYPALIPGDQAVAGRLLTGLSTNEWRIIDAFEDNVYELRRLALVDERHGWAYICQSVAGTTSDGWNADDFASRHLADYVANCVAWRKRYEQRSRPSQGLNT